MDYRPEYRRRKRHKNKFLQKYSTFFYLPLYILYLELFTRIFATVKFNGFILAACFDIAAGVFLTLVALLFHKKIARILLGLFSSGIAFWYTFNVVIQNNFRIYMPIKNITAGAGNAATEFGSSVWSAIVGSLFRILILFLPAILYWIFLRKLLKFPYLKPAKKGMILDGCLILFTICVLICTVSSLKSPYRTSYSYDSAVRNFGVLTATRLDIQYSVFGNPGRKTLAAEETKVVKEEPETAETETAGEQETAEAETAAEPETKVDWGRNEMDIDFSLYTNTGNADVDQITNYVSSLTASSKNEYTGLFEGKNLILICAEAFDMGVIDPVMTPTLYRLKNNGIVFEEFYQPFWGGSTSTGEFSFVFGLAPLDGIETIIETEHNNNYFTPGNQLQRQNYYNAAFHNGDCNYYDRMYTHNNLGYRDWLADGDGLEELLVNGFFYSDINLMEATVPLYIDKTPFSVYYMSFSGHAPYLGDDYYAVYNMDLVNSAVGDRYSEKVKYYFAHQVEFDQALEYVVSALEEAGIADDTVIVICPDHFPYGLTEADAWETDRDYLPELTGLDDYQDWGQDISELIIWCGSLENEDKDMACTISAPTFSLDIVPTLSNLFGFEFDSRLLAGRDVFSDAEAICFWQNGSWVTEEGRYSSIDDTYYPNDPENDDRKYFHRIDRIVQNRLNLSDLIIQTDYYGVLFGEDVDIGRQIYPQSFYMSR